MSVMVEEVTTAKTGKSLRVKLGGQWYGAALTSGLNGAKGKMIEAEIETGNFGPWIKGYKVAAQQEPSSPPASSPVAPAAAAPSYAGRVEPGDNITPWYWPSVSNICSAAIEKGLITDPRGLNEWALKWAQVAQATKEAVR